MPAFPRRVLALVTGVTIAFAPMASLARQPDEPRPDATSPPEESRPRQIEVPPTVQLGLRLLTVWQRLPVAPVLVIVPDARSYLGALEHWQLGAMWPVLIDDGSDQARENIARFTRAYEPGQILRWAALDDDTPDDHPLAQRVDAMVARVWGAASPDELDRHWSDLNFAPPGVVVASEDDPAWVAGAALAAGRGQPIIWTAAPRGRPAQHMDAPELDALDHAIIAGLRAHPWSWDALGDDVDAVTLCLNAPGRIDPTPVAEGDFALTDRIGRHPDARRYAWCGIVFGNAAQSAYRAMCALFLTPDSAWVFDGYGKGYPAQFAAERALPLLEQRGIPVTFTSPQGATLEVWRGRCRTGIEGGYVHVNSAGYPSWFQLARKERAFASETPLLDKPSIVHFIHSFSARLADNPRTISGRWLENGAYAYIGAVHEPTLAGFVSPEQYFGRLFSGVPLGAAPRRDDAPPWKLQVIGDPLIIAAPPRPRRESAPALDGATSLDQLMKAALNGRRIADAIALLVQLGRDDDALRLARSALEQDDDATDRAALARAAVYPAFRAADPELFARLYELLPPKVAADDAHQSMLWQMLRPLVIVRDPDPRFVNLLRHNMRDQSALEDATDLRPAISSLYGREAVDSMFLELIERARNEKTKERLRAAMNGASTGG